MEDMEDDKLNIYTKEFRTTRQLAAFWLKNKQHFIEMGYLATICITPPVKDVENLIQLVWWHSDKKNTL
jgi:hypothetical protein